MAMLKFPAEFVGFHLFFRVLGDSF